MFTKLYIPFYIWSAKACSEYSGEIGKQHYHKKENNPSHTEIHWTTVCDESHYNYSELSVCASFDQRINQLVSKIPCHDNLVPCFLTTRNLLFLFFFFIFFFIFYN
jgi:hypothetical protein